MDLLNEPKKPEKPTEPTPEKLTEPTPEPERKPEEAASDAAHTSQPSEPGAAGGDLLGGLGADDQAAETPGDKPPPEPMSREQFFMMFRGGIGAPNLMLKPPLQSLVIAESDQAARQASDAIYETCLEVPALRFLIEPTNKWLQRALIVGGFGYGVYASCMAEIAARKPPPKAAKEQDNEPATAAAVPDNEPGVDQGVRTLKARPANDN